MGAVPVCIGTGIVCIRAVILCIECYIQIQRIQI